MNLQRWFGDVPVADLRDAFPHQGTWVAEDQQMVTPEQGRLLPLAHHPSDPED